MNRDRRFMFIVMAIWCGVSVAGPRTHAQDVVMEKPIAPPVAPIKPTVLEKHGITRVDDYYWLRDRDNPEVLQYLRDENDYLERVLAPTEQLQKTLFEELKAREKQTDASVPSPRAPWWYYSRMEDGKQYSVHCRRPIPGEPRDPPRQEDVAKLDTPGDGEQILVDVNEVSEGHEFCSVPGVKVTSDGRIMAYAVDLVGRRKYTIRFRDLESGKPLPDEIVDVTPMFVWAEDNQTLFYVRQDPETLRPFQVYRHKLGTSPAADVLVYQEDDEEFMVALWRSRSRKYILIGSLQTISSEYRLIDALHPEQPWQLFSPRKDHHEYDVDHIGDTFYIVTNDNARNFRLMKTNAPGIPVEQWEEVIPHRPDIYLEDVVLMDDWLIAIERKDATTQLRVLDHDGKEDHTVAFDETAYSVYPAPIEETNTPWLRFVYTSLSTPPTTYDYHLKDRNRVLIKQEEVLGGFDPSRYYSERLWAPARDGSRIPVSVVRRRDTPVDGSAPLLLYGYGSYGATMTPDFDSNVISLLDRGWIYAIAHVRGGHEMGRPWYESGKLLKKMNTFTDFIDVAEYLKLAKYANPHRIYAEGGSAGGLLMGAVMNLRPDLFAGIVAEVPFVDVVTTMLDESIPLTTGEYDEWGDPNEEEYFRYMLSYSPYDNVQRNDYPHLLITTGLHDSQVQYWEPAKWIAKLRALRSNNDRLLLMKTNMSAGHGGASGRFDRHKETALRYAFLLHIDQSR